MDPPIGRPSKRARTDPLPSETASVSNIKRSLPWFDDGNVILQVEMFQFKVYSGMLSAKSEVFRDMFSIPQPAGGDDMVDGCHIVHLSDDPEDVRYVLEALYNGRYITTFASIHILLQSNIASEFRNYNEDKKLQPLPVLAAFLRLGRKYEIRQLYIEAASRISREFPSTLEKWEEAQGKALEISPSPTLAFDMIDVARRTGFYAALPAALYYCCSGDWDMSDIFEGVKREDGSIAVLSLEDQKACLGGKQALTRVQADETFSWLNTGELICDSSLRCDRARKSLFYDMNHPVQSCIALQSWLPEWSRLLCDSCAVEAKESHNEGRAKVWDTLPSIFGLPPWKELLKE